MSKVLDRRVLLVGRESTLTSIIRDTYTFACLAGVVGIGIYFQSGILQFFGGLTWLVWLIGRVMKIYRRQRWLTIDEARSELAEMENEGVDHDRG